MIVHRLGPTVVLAIAVAGLLCAGCASQPGPGSVASVAPSSPAATIQPTPLESPRVTPSSSLAPEPATEPPASPVDTPIPEPPAASLAVEGGDPVVGELGSFTWDNTGSDAPWVPGTPIRVAPGERLELTLASAVRLERWTVSRTPGATFGSDIIGVAEGSASPVAFAAPPRGTWSVNVSVRFGGNLGSAAYYWLITVD